MNINESSLGQTTARLWPASTGASFSGEDMDLADIDKFGPTPNEVNRLGAYAYWIGFASGAVVVVILSRMVAFL
jgi:hypothetical protein